MTDLQRTLPATLASARLRLVTPSLAHVPQLVELANDRRIHEMLSRLPHPYTPSHGRDFVENIARGPEEFAWFILERFEEKRARLSGSKELQNKDLGHSGEVLSSQNALEADRFIGVIGLHFLPGQIPELGYWLGQPYWGRGYASEAGRAVIGAARQAGARTLRARALLTNKQSRKVLEKIGFFEIGIAIDQTGTLAGQEVMRMLWEAKR